MTQLVSTSPQMRTQQAGGRTLTTTVIISALLGVPTVSWSTIFHEESYVIRKPGKLGPDEQSQTELSL